MNYQQGLQPGMYTSAPSQPTFPGLQYPPPQNTPPLGMTRTIEPEPYEPASQPQNETRYFRAIPAPPDSVTPAKYEQFTAAYRDALAQTVTTLLQARGRLSPEIEQLLNSPQLNTELENFFLFSLFNELYFKGSAIRPESISSDKEIPPPRPGPQPQPPQDAFRSLAGMEL